MTSKTQLSISESGIGAWAHIGCPIQEARNIEHENDPSILFNRVHCT